MVKFWFQSQTFSVLRSKTLEMIDQMTEMLSMLLIDGE